MLNTMVCGVDLLYGTIIKYAVNVIVENILSQVDEDGYTLNLMEGIINYNKENTYVSN